MADIEIYTDGACKGNPGPGGWGAILSSGNHQREMRGGEKQTTNNRMELTAAIRALEALKTSSSICLYTDSQYVRQGITQWMPKWKMNGWRTSNKTAVKNVDLWQRLDELAMQHSIEWVWVKGHSGHAGNERADQLANLAIDDLAQGVS